MTTFTTPRDIRSPRNGTAPKLDSPAVSARARARIPITQSTHKIRDQVRVGFRQWRGWTLRPLSFRALWAASAVNTERIPAGNRVLLAVWHVSNWTDRLLMFALILLAPTALTGPLRLIAARPTRRYGTYLTITALTGAYLIGRN